MIVPETKIETSDGHTCIAKNMRDLHLNFPEQLPQETASPDPSPFAAVSPMTNENIQSPPIPSRGDVVLPVSDEKNQTPPQLSRAVFIFLAVFVGLFGVHDFYAKRVRQGYIHLALLLPWILLFLVSILAVFGVTLYAVSYSPNRQEIRETQQALKEGEKARKDCEQKIWDCENQIEATKRELAAANAGKKRIIPQQGQREEIIPRQERPEVIRPQPEAPGRIPAPPVNPIVIVPPSPEIDRTPPEIDRKYVQDLEDTLRELERKLGALQNSLNDLERQQRQLEDALIALRLEQGAMRIQAWALLGPLWLYFFFYVLPFASWVMAMVEIVYVTRDGTGRLLGKSHRQVGQ